MAPTSTERSNRTQQKPSAPEAVEFETIVDPVLGVLAVMVSPFNGERCCIPIEVAPELERRGFTRITRGTEVESNGRDKVRNGEGRGTEGA